MSSLEISLLGAPRIEVDGRGVALDTRKGVALLAYLAVTDRPHTRDALCALLWPDYDHEHARGALRRTLSALRKALGSDRLDAGREHVALVRDDRVQIDVDLFRSALAAGDPGSLDRAVELYGGDLLAGFSLRDSVNFDDWQYFESESLRREFADALERLASEHAERRDYDRAILLARRWLSLNPLHEPVHRRLMELFALKGERGAALRQYRECVRVLDTQLGVSPVDETIELYRAIQEERVQAPSTPPRPKPPRTVAPTRAAPDRPPLVGRADEWDALQAAYEKLSAEGRLVVIEGEAGIGKTSLAAELVRHVSEGGGPVITVRCYEEERELAFAPVAETVRQALVARGGSDAALAEAARLLPQLGAPPDLPLDTPGAQTRFFESIASLVHGTLAGSPPGLLLVDDAHWADASSVEFFAFLVRRLVGQPLLVLLTWRSADVPAAHPLRRLLLDSGRERGAIARTLRRLAREEVDELVRALTPGAAAGAIDRIYEESDGVPLLVVEYSRALERGEAAPPEGVRELLRARLLPLSDVAAQVVAAAAVIGRSFDLDVLREVSGRTEDEIVSALEELTARGVLDEAGAAYDFRHERLRSVVDEELSLARRRLLHGRAADALAHRGGASGPLAGSIARHYQLAGRDTEAARFFRLAGEHARSLFANADALADFHAALALGDPDPASLHAAIGDLQTLVGDYDAAERSYEAAAAVADRARLAGVEHKLGAIHLRRGSWDVAASYLDSALGNAEGDAALAARVTADLSLALHRAGDTAKARELAGKALALADEGDDAAQAQAHNILGLLAASEGDAETARPHLEQSLVLTARAEDPDARVAALNNLALVLRGEGSLDRALELTEEALRLCSARGDRHREAALHNNLADLLRASGRSGEAMEHLKHAASLFADVGSDAGAEPEIWKLVSW